MRTPIVLPAGVALAIVAALGAAAFFFGGFVNVAAADDDPALVDWALLHALHHPIVYIDMGKLSHALSREQRPAPAREAALG